MPSSLLPGWSYESALCSCVTLMLLHSLLHSTSPPGMQRPKAILGNCVFPDQFFSVPQGVACGLFQTLWRLAAFQTSLCTCLWKFKMLALQKHTLWDCAQRKRAQIRLPRPTNSSESCDTSSFVCTKSSSMTALYCGASTERTGAGAVASVIQRHPELPRVRSIHRARLCDYQPHACAMCDSAGEEHFIRCTKRPLLTPSLDTIHVDAVFPSVLSLVSQGLLDLAVCCLFWGEVCTRCVWV
jgi:hypothetical protein